MKFSMTLSLVLAVVMAWSANSEASFKRKKPAAAICDQSRQVEQPILTTESSYPKNYTGTLNVLVDRDTKKICFVTYTDSEDSARKYTVEELKGGAVLLEFMGKKLLTIAGPQFNDQFGGPMWMTFLRVFLGDDRRKVDGEVYLNASRSWFAQSNDTEGRAPFTHIKLYIKTAAGVPTGVNRIQLFEGKNVVRDYDTKLLPEAEL